MPDPLDCASQGRCVWSPANAGCALHIDWSNDRLRHRRRRLSRGLEHPQKVGLSSRRRASTGQHRTYALYHAMFHNTSSVEDASYRILSYAAEIEVDTARGSIKGTVDITLRSEADRLSEISLSAHHL